MAITQATSLADFSTGIGTAGAVLKVDNADGQVGIGTTDPQGTLQVGIAITMDGTAGVITASSFSGSGSNLSFTGADISAATGTFTGNVSVGGTLTYEDVTNIDAVGVITARTGVKVTAGGVDVTAGGLNVTAGIATFGGAVNVTGAVTLNANLDLQDNDKILLGTGDDLQIYHDGSASYIAADDLRVTNGAVSETLAKFINGGAVELYHNDSKKLETTSDGVTFTGAAQLTATQPQINFTAGGSAVAQAGQILVGENGGGGDLLLKTKTTGGTLTTRLTVGNDGTVNLPDNGKLTAGAGDDLEIYHDGTNSVIDNNTGDLNITTTGSGDDIYLDAADDIYLRVAGNESGVSIIGDGAVELYHNNSKKLETSSAGVTVTGTLNATTAVTQNGTALATNGKAVAMALVFG
tara:strand:+ start:278 stop:1504 length:1227 start_codon:yes stop_codon:yes gene_type:complete